MPPRIFRIECMVSGGGFCASAMLAQKPHEDAIVRAPMRLALAPLRHLALCCWQTALPSTVTSSMSPSESLIIDSTAVQHG
ncbi:hypothetical protein AU476_03700 [Cupriavidus sp. UYMSc13B]|nr:hypothetical protein AU476_03700 [Cupriavidus sp. UYMSc13B]